MTNQYSQEVAYLFLHLCVDQWIETAIASNDHFNHAIKGNGVLIHYFEITKRGYDEV